MDRGTPEQRLRNLPHYQTEHAIDLDTDKVLSEAKSMYKSVIASSSGSGPFIGFSEHYERLYPYLYERCPKWFRTIFENRMGSDANFMYVLENMLNTIKDIQSKKISNFEGDKYIGTALYDKYGIKEDNIPAPSSSSGSRKRKRSEIQ